MAETFAVNQTTDLLVAALDADTDTVIDPGETV